jgi:hypothetical protein
VTLSLDYASRADVDKLRDRVAKLEEYLASLAPLPVSQDPEALERPGPVVYPTRVQEA